MHKSMRDDLENQKASTTAPQSRTSLSDVLKAFSRGEFTREQVMEVLKGQSAHIDRASVERRWRHDEPFLAAHIVQGQQVLLGTTLCSMAAQIPVRDVIGLRNLVLIEPVVVPEGRTAEVLVRPDEKDPRKVFGRYSIS